MSRLFVSVPALLASLVVAVGCQSAPEQAPTLHRVDESPSPHIDPDDPFQSPAPAAPENDIPESDRIEFHEKHTLAPLAPLVPIPTDSAALGLPTERDGEPTRPTWWPPISSSRAYTGQDAIDVWDTLRRSHEEVMGPHWNRFGWYDW